MKVLFIGNSYTRCNNLLGILKELSNAAGQTLETAMVTSGGKTLEWHWYNPATLDAVDQGQWDFIVLQDHSLRGRHRLWNPFWIGSNYEIREKGTRRIRNFHEKY